MHSTVRSLFAPLALAGALTACGGGVSIGFFDDGEDFFFPTAPFSSGRPATITVSAATDTRFVGVYAAADARVGSIFRFSGDPDTCRFLFEGLQQQGSSSVLAGEIRYIVNGNAVLTTIVTIDSLQFRVDGGSSAIVDRASNSIVYSAATLVNTQGLGGTVTLNGSIPLRNESRPAGC